MRTFGLLERACMQQVNRCAAVYQIFKHSFSRKSLLANRETNPSKKALAGSRLLLGHAVERAQTNDEIAACNTGHFAVRKQTRKRIQRHAVIIIIEGWYDTVII